jgi:mono/diheme cytochrome c family protein
VRAACLACVALATWLAQRPLPPGVSEEMISAGQPLFDGPGRCKSCHGPNGKGTKRGPNLADAHWIHIRGSYDEIIHVIVAGVPDPKKHPLPMPPRGNSKISDAEVRAVAAYVWSLSHPAVGR